MDSYNSSSSQNELPFNDILSQKRNQNDISWITRTIRPKFTSVQHRKNINPLVFRYKVLTDPSIRTIIREAYPNEPASHHFQRINTIVQEIGCSKSLKVVRWLGFILIKIMKRIMHSILINEAKLLKIRSTMGRNPLVFVPTHRSYADFILMAFLCFNYDIDIPVVVAAMDFHAMFGMATVLRQCGAMYMRRSFKGDFVYSAIFKKYVQTIITDGNSPFEFFIEGTRSRCGKSLTPRLGILKMIVEVYLKEAVSDITFVPISINYDRLLEDSLFAREMIGIPKPKESTTGLLRGISLLEEQYGNIYVNVGDEISLKEFYNIHQNNDLLAILAHTIVRKQQRNIVLTYFNLLSSIIIGQLMFKKSSYLSIAILIEEVASLKYILTASGACMNWSNNKDELIRSLNIHKFLILDEDGEIIQLPFLSSCESNRKHVFNSAETMILLQHYSNSCYHFLVNPAIVIVILKADKQLNKADLFLKYNFFRLLFKHEFLFYEAFAGQDFDDACCILQNLNMVEPTQNDGFKLNDTNDIWFNLMFPYMRGYLFVYQSLLQLIPRTLNKMELTTRIRKQLELELEICNDFSLFYGLSSNLISCASSSLLDAGVLDCEEYA